MTSRVDKGVAQLSRELADGIAELEGHYYTSTSAAAAAELGSETSA